jgi:hypothetical protein
MIAKNWAESQICRFQFGRCTIPKLCHQDIGPDTQEYVEIVLRYVDCHTI